MYRVTTVLAGTYVSGGGFNTLYFDEGGGTAAQAVTAAKTFWAAFSTQMMTGTTATTRATVELVFDETGEVTGVSSGTAGTTTATGGSEALAPQSQLLVQWRTGLYSDGREVRGRTNIPAMMESANTLGAPSSALVTLADAAAAALVSDANSQLVIWRRPRPERPQVGNPGDPWYLPAQTARIGISAAVTASGTWGKWATLRSRRD